MCITTAFMTFLYEFTARLSFILVYKVDTCLYTLHSDTTANM